MSVLDDTDQARVSSNTAEEFVDAYYNALNGSRPTLQSFYIPKTTMPGGRLLPHISYNGEIVNDAAILQKTFEDQMPWTHYEPQAVDVQVLNPTVVVSDPKASKKEHERNMSFVVQVSGYVRLHERKDGPLRGFSDSFVLVPNKEAAGGKQTGKLDNGRQWVIQTQNFRFVV